MRWLLKLIRKAHQSRPVAVCIKRKKRMLALLELFYTWFVGIVYNSIKNDCKVRCDCIFFYHIKAVGGMLLFCFSGKFQILSWPNCPWNMHHESCENITDGCARWHSRSCENSQNDYKYPEKRNFISESWAPKTNSNASPTPSSRSCSQELIFSTQNASNFTK